MEILYLACPYSKGDASVRLARFHAANHAAAKLIAQKKVVFSPITMTHPIDLVLAGEGKILDSDYWVGFDLSFMQHCSQISVLTLPGWDESSGVKREIEYFKQRGVKAQLLKPLDYAITAENPLFSAAFLN